MSTPWIKVRTNLMNDPRVVCVAEELNMDRYAVVGRLVAFWAWADEYSADGNGLIVTSSFLDQHFSCLGLASALRKIGWLSGQEGNLSIPNFTDHNGQSARSRSLTADRVKKHKASEKKREGNDAIVTHSLSLSNTSGMGGAGGKADVVELRLPFELEEFRAAWEAFVKHRTEIRKPLKPTSTTATLEKLSGMGEGRAVTALKHTTAMGWQGIREPDGVPGVSGGKRMNFA